MRVKPQTAGGSQLGRNAVWGRLCRADLRAFRTRRLHFCLNQAVSWYFARVGTVRRQRKEKRLGGQYVSITGPIRLLRGTVPHVRESQE